ncbi:hypothetical protein ACH4HG_22575 [Streptomyces coeruleorubidus]|uniref:hypothetical protein n=1 Tax=Streptomyces coeruleorubidus TaxID=116188 RepID=UPI0037B6508C
MPFTALWADRTWSKLLLRHVEQIRPHLEHAVRVLGVQHAWGRNAAPVSGADGGQPRPWTLPVSYHEIRGLVTAVRTACLILTAAASGMRTSELLELRVGSRLSPRMVTGGGQRFRLASKVIKGRQFGGENDECPRTRLSAPPCTKLCAPLIRPRRCPVRWPGGGS